MVILMEKNFTSVIETLISVTVLNINLKFVQIRTSKKPSKEVYSQLSYQICVKKMNII